MSLLVPTFNKKHYMCYIQRVKAEISCVIRGNELKLSNALTVKTIVLVMRNLLL